MSEQQPKEEDNVHYMDEYPELSKKVWLRRLNRQRQVGETALTRVFVLPTVTELPRRDPDEPA